VKEVTSGIIERYGRIDGIIHGAGIIRDSFMAFMSSEDFKKVMDVKLSGFWNLFKAAEDNGLRFVVGLSSIVAVFGNPGQVNYCAANRCLSALIKRTATGENPILGKVLMLPPMDGAGMADDPEIKELMKLRDMDSAYVHVNELGELFCREMTFGSPDDLWVMPVRSLPQVTSTLIDLVETDQEHGALSEAGVRFKRNDLPMIHRIIRQDLKTGHLTVERTFSLTEDPWIIDHKPFKFLKHPLVSGIMAVETFLEAAHLLFPYLSVWGVKDVTYKDILECRPDQDREARITCRIHESEQGRIVCSLELKSRDISPSGRPMDTWISNYEGQVILGSQMPPQSEALDLIIQQDKLNTSPIFHEEIQKWYKDHTALVNRYQVIEQIAGIGPGVIKGSMLYKDPQDFSGIHDALYQYPPYVLEAVMHLATIYA
jgi:hypothetical protein